MSSQNWNRNVWLKKRKEETQLQEKARKLKENSQ
jgi:hypothetical protein